ncbi:hypothetical protein OSCI_3550003 [Kamptonema sp. PCC 6506]|nr:hypothetical protein OSCI_3550003 [Kamptonema sp. PCC 6506]
MRAPRSNRKVLRLLRGARNDKYLTGHDIIGIIAALNTPFIC